MISQEEYEGFSPIILSCRQSHIYVHILSDPVLALLWWLQRSSCSHKPKPFVFQPSLLPSHLTVGHLFPSLVAFSLKVSSSGWPVLDPQSHGHRNQTKTVSGTCCTTNCWPTESVHSSSKPCPLPGRITGNITCTPVTSSCHYHESPFPSPTGMNSDCPAFGMSGVSGTWNCKVLKKDVVNLFLIISNTHKLWTSCSSFTWHHRSSAIVHLLQTKKLSPTAPVLIRISKQSLQPKTSGAAYLFCNSIWASTSICKIYFVPVLVVLQTFLYLNNMLPCPAPMFLSLSLQLTSYTDIVDT